MPIFCNDLSTHTVVRSARLRAVSTLSKQVASPDTWVFLKEHRQEWAQGRRGCCCFAPRSDQRPFTENASNTLTSFDPVLAAPILPDIV